MDDIKTRPTRGEYARRRATGRPVTPRPLITASSNSSEPKITEEASTIRLAENANYVEQNQPEPIKQSVKVRRFSKATRAQKRANKQLNKQGKHKKTGKIPKSDDFIVIRLPKWAAQARSYTRKHKVLTRVLAGAMALVLILGLGYELYQQRQTTVVYNFTGAETNLLSEPSPTLAQKLKYDTKSAKYQFNEGYTAQADNVANSGNGPKITATFGSNQDKSVKITDPASKVDVTLTPRFAVAEPKQDQNRVVYPLIGKHISAVYSVGSVGVKEDLLVRQYQGDTLDFAYDLKLPDGLEARIEKDGSLGIYGVQNALLGNVTTSSEKDAELLQKARQNGEKTQLLFQIPKPIILDGKKKISKAGEASYNLDGTVLTVRAKDLKNANYPISIDPTVYVASAVQFMRGNNETNVDFDPLNDLIQKSQTTGARIDAWSSTNNLASATWGQGTAVAGGYIYTVGGGGGSSTTTSTYYSAGTSTYVVPAGVTSLTIKAWGGGGGGGRGSNSTGKGGNGGGGGYAKAVITVTPSESLDVTTGTGGAGGAGNSRGGDGGGFSSVQRSGTYLLQAGGGGGGGGARGTNAGGGGNGGAGNSGTEAAGNGSTGAGGGSGGGGARGTTAAGGTAGALGTGGTAGSVGAANGGGNGGGFATNCNTAVTNTQGGAGGFGAGGGGGIDTTTCADGGGGGGGRYGGGGGGSTTSGNRGGGGAGGGSSLVTGTSTVQTAGSGQTPGNNSDSERSGAAEGGTGGTNAGSTTSGTDGAVIVSYTISSATTTDAVSWAKFDPTSKSIESPNPGNGLCTGWCTNAAYNLPQALRGLSLKSYNGFLYAIGGSTSAGTPQTTVYIAKLGANGEPQLWHPSGGTPVYWYTETTGALTNARSYFGAVAYNNRLYIVGGLTTSTTVLSSNTVQYADIKPTGSISAWSTTGMSALSTSSAGNRYGVSAEVYNDTLYVIGGDATFSGSPVANVDYAKLNSDGSMNSWVQTQSLSSGVLTMGGSFSTIFGGYIYVGGGCSAVNGSGYCTTMASSVQLTSINADGSLAGWNTILNLTNQRIGHTLIAWQGGLYRLGGCRAQDTGTGSCTDTVLDVDYGRINDEGEASTVADSVASGVAPCSGGNPSGCDLPGVSIIGNVLTGSAIMNGYLYIWGGCSNTTSGCGTVSRGVIFTSVGSDGSLTKPTTCGSWTAVDAYCYNATSLPAGGAGAPGTAIFNGYIYSVGGFTAGGGVGNIYYAAPSLTDGTISSWSTASITGIGASNVSYAYSFARANPASAGSTPGNLYILGGCSGPAGIGCSNYADNVYKCTLSTSGVPAACSENPGGSNQQLQLGIIPGDSATGLGAMAGTIYANYIYLMGGLTPNQTDLKTTRYAKIDDNNNIVDAGTGSGSGSWTESTSLTFYGRRRGSGFGYNGFLYVVGGYDGSGGGGGILADIEFAKINVSDGSIGGWTVSSVNINQRWGLNVRVSNSYAYVIGGCVTGAAPTCSAAGQTNSIQTFQIYNNDSGAVQTYSSSANNFSTSTDRWGASSTILNGYIYVAGGCTSATDCTTATSDIQYAQIDASNGSIGTWAATTKGIGQAAGAAQLRTWGRLVTVGGYLYYLGGQTSTATDERAEIYYVQPSVGGNITSNWAPTTKGIGQAGGAAQERTKFGVAVWDNRIYVVGGLNASAAAQSTVYVSPQLNSGGDITGNWSTLTSFNVARYGAAVTAYANNIYIFGGIDGSGNYLNDVQFTSVGYKTGTISQSGTTLSGSGTSWNSGMVGSTVQYIDGSTATISGYTNGTTLTVNVSKTVTAGTSYAIQDGSVGAWVYSTSMPDGLAQSEAFGANGYMYVIGGRTAATTCTPKTLVTPISANTFISAGNNPTGVGDWFETNVKYSGDRYGAAVSYANGKLYMMGGGCTAPLSTNIHYYANLKSQPMVAKYSRMIDVDTDVFPTAWLMNGIDNAIGARWQVKYKSMHDVNPLVVGGSDSVKYDKGTITQSGTTVTGTGTSWTAGMVGSTIAYADASTATISSVNVGGQTMVVSASKTIASAQNYAIWTLQQNPNEDCGTSSSMATMTTWGQETNYGNAYLGDVAPYTAKNSGGSNINCARYFYFNVSIDASQTYGYPEDVQRGPTISDISLLFTADPSKRLRHGATFTGGELQPLDTPCRQSVDTDCPLP